MKPRYKVRFDRNYQVIDTRTRTRRTVFVTSNEAQAYDICGKLNDGIPLSEIQVN